MKYRLGSGLHQMQNRYGQELAQASFRTVHVVLTENKGIYSSALITSTIFVLCPNCGHNIPASP